MDRQTRRTPRTQAPSLIPLESALIAAQKLTPSRAPRPLLDPDEVLAARLIENIRHPQPASFLAMQIEPPQPLIVGEILEMVGSDV